MKIEKKQKLLKEFLEVYKEFIYSMEFISDVFAGDIFESEYVGESIQSFIDGYFQTIKGIVKDDDNWLEWFIFDHDFGNFEPKVTIDGTAFVVNDIDSFIELYFGYLYA